MVLHPMKTKSKTPSISQLWKPLSSKAPSKAVLVLACMTSLVAPQAFSQASQQCEFPALKELKSGSEVSTYVYHFWDYVRKELDQKFPGSKYIQEARGQVAGDFHFKNLGIYFSKKQNQPSLAIVDLDDSGTANQFGDLLKFLVFIQADYDSNKYTAEALQAYSLGLDPASRDDLFPSKLKIDSELKPVANLLSQDTKSDFFKSLNQKYVEKKMTGSKNKLKPDPDLKPLSELEKLKKGKELKSAELVLANHVTKTIGAILDRGFQVNESGSSKDAVRFIYLVATKDGPSIIEMKQLTCPGTLKFESQQDQATRFKNSKNNLGSAEFWDESQVITIGSFSFLQRKKGENPLANKKILDGIKKNLKEWVQFYSYTLGRVHRQTAQASFAQKLEQKVKDAKELEQLSKKVNNFVESYLAHLKKSLK